jgi:hypothetical protein
LVILDPTGTELASRELPMRGESCSTLAQAIALVVDQFFRDLAAPSGSPSDAMPPPRAGANTSVAAPSKPEAAIPEPTADARKPSKERRATLPVAPRQGEPSLAQGVQAPPKSKTPTNGAKTPGGRSGMIMGVGYESVPSAPAASIGLFVAATPSFRFDLRAALPTISARESFRSGWAYLYPVPLRLSFMYLGPHTSRLRGFAGPEILASLERASTTGVVGGHSGWRVAAGIGARLGAAYWFSPSVALAGSFCADHVVWNSRRFLLDSDTELRRSNARLAGVFELWGALFP